MSGLVQIPVEVVEQAHVFDVVTRGYSRTQVHRQLAALEQELAELRWERAELATLQRRRDELAAEMLYLSARLVAVVHRLGRTDAPLDLTAG